MAFAYPIQKFQDWFTQQWVILWGKKISPKEFDWLMGPFGEIESISDNFPNQLAIKENLVVEQTTKPTGLVPSIETLQLDTNERHALSKHVADFYENTSDYDLSFGVKWNPLFKPFGFLVSRLFSTRINQLNIPTSNKNFSETIKSEIISLVDPVSGQKKYTFWRRSYQSDDRPIYTGVYGTCVLPSGKTCIKAVFPLPQGNATVILVPRVGKNGELILDSSGRAFGDAGFYFLLRDSKGSYWAQYISSFRDTLTVFAEGQKVSAHQQISLWHHRVVDFEYQLRRKT